MTQTVNYWLLLSFDYLTHLYLRYSLIKLFWVFETYFHYYFEMEHTFTNIWKEEFIRYWSPFFLCIFFKIIVLLERYHQHSSFCYVAMNGYFAYKIQTMLFLIHWREDWFKFPFKRGSPNDPVPTVPSTALSGQTPPKTSSYKSYVFPSQFFISRSSDTLGLKIAAKAHLKVLLFLEI